MRILRVVVIVLLALIVAGTVYAFLANTRAKKLAQQDSSEPTKTSSAPDVAIFSLGTIRATTRDKVASTVIATIAFPYRSGDSAAFNELKKQEDELRKTAQEFLASKTADELAPAYEDAIKAGLRDHLGAKLALTDLTEIYLSDFTVVK